MALTKAANVSIDDTLLKLGVTDLQHALVVLVARLVALEAQNITLRAVTGLDFSSPDGSGNLPGL